jgi:uncharacterized caspase-like protein
MKYALLIGIGYINTQHALEGPLRDVYKIKETLVDYECTIITDHTETIPTKKVIVEAFLELLQKKGPLFFYYSGHGQEEGIFCADQEILTHDEFRGMLNTMDPLSTLVAVLDTCYSGDMFELAYQWTGEWHKDRADTPGHVFLLSSSQEDELSYEYGKAGAFTVAYIDTIKRPQTWNVLMEKVIQKLKVELDLQTPELSTGQPENLDTIFEI